MTTIDVIVAEPVESGACDVHRIDITPSAKGPGGHYWYAYLGTERIAEAKADAALAACRAIEAQGITGTIDVWHRGAAYPSMRIKIAAGAKLTVTDGGSAGTRFVKWKPFVGVASDSHSPLCGEAEEADLFGGGMHPSENGKPPSTA